jgi:hypothetical protein
VHNMTNGSYLRVPVEITLNGQLADRTASGITFEYYGPNVLTMGWVYPVAGPKGGGTRVTLYGTGFKTLAHPIMNDVDWSTGIGQSTRGLKCIFGDLPMSAAHVVFPIGSDRARAALGDDPDVDGDEQPLASVLECDTPPWSNQSTYYLPREDAEEDRCSAEDDRALCELDEPKTVCVRVSLNDDPMQHSGGCVKFTFFDE